MAKNALIHITFGTDEVGSAEYAVDSSHSLHGSVFMDDVWERDQLHGNPTGLDAARRLKLC